jgi:hypothetical protein
MGRRSLLSSASPKTAQYRTAGAPAALVRHDAGRAPAFQARWAPGRDTGPRYDLDLTRANPDNFAPCDRVPGRFSGSGIAQR